MRGSRAFRGVFAAFLALMLAACGVDDYESDSGGSSGGSNYGYNWPAYIVGERIEFTVTDSGTSGISEGKVVVYQFNSAGSVVGTNPETGVTYTPSYYSYTPNGSSAQIYLDYNGPWERYTLRSSTSTSGTYSYRGDAGLGERYNSGTYRIVTSSTGGGGSTGGGRSGGGGSTQACETDNTGELTIWTSKSTGGATNVSINGSPVGSLTQYFTSAPRCGQTSGVITKTLRAGSYRYYAEDSDSYWSGTVSVTQCGCMSLQLRP